MMKFKNKRIPLSKLVLHPANVRGQQGYDEKGIEVLACMIENQGHIAPLMVQPLDGGKDGVLAGGRRLRAFELLEATGRLADNMIDCRLVPKDVPAETAISLAENITHEPCRRL